MEATNKQVETNMQHEHDFEVEGTLEHGVPDAQLAIAGNVFVKWMHFDKGGQVMRGHKHTYDHVTLLASGSVRAESDGIVVEFKAPHLIITRAGKIHAFTALEDKTIVACVHALRDESGEILPENADIHEAYQKIPLLTEDGLPSP
jgi:quercetin dioxygenase-like cupin family protein